MPIGAKNFKLVLGIAGQHTEVAVYAMGTGPLETPGLPGLTGLPDRDRFPTGARTGQARPGTVMLVRAPDATLVVTTQLSFWMYS